MDVADIALKRTCIACPEQYDAINLATNVVIGYLRLRHGHFTVEVPGPFGKLVYESWPEGDGGFEDDEREDELISAIEAIANAYPD
ncbi:MAG: hypothetical protein BZ138_07195 [Methanosphaera sp. rholeuAM270]|nr:MAG: hypothetical protein BZ138_07195 [Methanosphaera sp. rholeuAM270]